MGRRAELHRGLSSSEEWSILVLWMGGEDTYDISVRLGVHECEIANRLLMLRERQNQGRQCEAT